MSEIMVFASLKEAQESALRLTDAHMGLIKFSPIPHPNRHGFFALEATDFIGRTAYYKDRL